MGAKQEKKRKNNGVRSVERVLNILEVLAEDRGCPKGITEISQKTGLGKSTVHRLINTVQAKGYVDQDKITDKYKLGLKLVELGNLIVVNMEIRTVARPYLEELMKEAQQTIHMAILHDNYIVYIDKVENTGSIRMASYIGLRGYIHCTALGKAITAFLPEEEVMAILEVTGMPRKTNNTITSPIEFKDHLAEVRRRGYAVDDIENEDKIRCIATPIFNHEGKPIAAVSISGTVLHVTVDRVADLAKVLLEKTQKISASLGYKP
jgi:DNA-binding IclR family transcriptional regulator